MSTGVEIIPIYLAFLAASGIYASIRGSIYAADTLADKVYKKVEIDEKEIPNVLPCKENVETYSPDFTGDGAGDEMFQGHFRQEMAVTKALTVMNDEDLLLATLDDYGFEHTVEEGIVKATLDIRRITFEKNDGGVYEAKFIGGGTGAAEQTVSELNEIYARKVQQRVYENLMARANAKGLILESQETQNDNSIVLTFVVRED
jgi:hypothetical protein